MTTGKSTKPVHASVHFRAADYLRTRADVCAYIAAALEDGDARVLPVASHTVADALGGLAALCECR